MCAEERANARERARRPFFRRRGDSNTLRAMDDISPTFPTLRSWQRMSESDQDALLDNIESRRRWRSVRVRALILAACVAAGIAAGIVLYLAT